MRCQKHLIQNWLELRDEIRASRRKTGVRKDLGKEGDRTPEDATAESKDKRDGLEADLIKRQDEWKKGHRWEEDI